VATQSNILKRLLTRYYIELSNPLEDRKPMYRSRMERITIKEQTQDQGVGGWWQRCQTGTDPV
jgi:hypothetical protein